MLLFADAEGQQALQSYITQIKDVLPDYGDGFLAAALQHFSYNSEQVIHALLEGGLPPDLQALDPHQPLQAPTQAKAKGKGAARTSESKLITQTDLGYFVHNTCTFLATCSRAVWFQQVQYQTKIA